MKPRISVIINTLNEEERLAYALRSVYGWADEIVVVDMYSQDRTVEIARQFEAKVFYHEKVVSFDVARRFALEQTTGDWVLALDADEILPALLAARLVELARSGVADVIKVPRLNYFFGAPILHTGWGPEQDFQTRFFKRGQLTYSSQLHDFTRPAPGARIHSLPYEDHVAILHFAYVDCSHFLDKLNRYTSIEATQAFELREPARWSTALLRAVYEFVNRYFRKEGYRDGWRGLCLSLFMAIYRIVTSAKLKELYATGGRDQIIRAYHDSAEALLAQTDHSSHQPLH